MNQKYSKFYLAGKLLAVFITASWLFETADTGILIIRMLVFGCLFALQLLLSMIKGGVLAKWGRLCQVGALLWAFFMGFDSACVITVVVGMELLDELVKGSLFYEIGSVLLLLLWFIYKPEKALLLFATIFIILLLCIRHVEAEREALWQENLLQKEKAAQLSHKLDAMKSYARTVQDTAVMEERNRFAARIHDQLGHNISGSIILLEGAALSLEKDPAGARKNIGLATENLRSGVDDIRAALRQERPVRSKLGLHEVKKALEEFEITYGKKTVLDTKGELEKITMPVWICIQDNLKEALTNMLKHSDGTEFCMQINCLNKAVRVEYADNGRCMEDIAPGMGLGGIEERTAACGGTALFTGGQGGFRIVTVFL